MGERLCRAVGIAPPFLGSGLSELAERCWTFCFGG